MRKHPLLVAAVIFMLLMSTSITSVWNGYNGGQVSVKSQVMCKLTRRADWLLSRRVK